MRSFLTLRGSFFYSFWMVPRMKLFCRRGSCILFLKKVRRQRVRPRTELSSTNLSRRQQFRHHLIQQLVVKFPLIWSSMSNTAESVSIFKTLISGVSSSSLSLRRLRCHFHRPLSLHLLHRRHSSSSSSSLSSSETSINCATI